MALKEYDALIQWLGDRHGEIMACEQSAMDELKAGRAAEYKSKMKEKALKISSLAEDCKPYMEAISPDKREEIARELERFSTSAKAGINLDSVFYMSALLYRDDHKEGEPDNLYVFIENLKNQ